MPTLRATFLDLDAHEVLRGVERTALTAPEVALLRLLMAAEGQPVSRQVLQSQALGFAPSVRSRAVDHAITRLRKKLEADPAAPDHLLSVYGVGYRWEAGVADPGLLGRSSELAALAASKARCVAIVGPGGIGKTRLARAFAAWRPHTWVSLQPCTDEGEALARLRHELDLDATAVIAQALAARGPHLLVLDEVEHLPGLEDHLAGWLDATESLQLLLTTRRLPGLACAVVQPRPLDEGETSELVRRRLGAAEAPYLSPALLALLGGLPLAAELAAARARVLDWQELAERAHHLDVLGDGRRSMRATLAGTWALLDEPGRQAWRALGVFRGGFDAAAWEAVWNGPDALDRLQQLVDWCLVRRSEGAPRFEVPETVRLFAADRLEEGDPALRGRHAAWYGRRGAALEAEVRLRGDPGWLRRERANLRAAFDSGRANHDVTRALDTALNLYGPPELRVRLMEVAVARTAEPGEAADTRWRLADALLRVGRPAEALAILEPPGDHPRCTLLRGSVQLALGRLDEAEATLERAEALLVADPARVAIARFNRSHILALRGHLDAASELARQALAELDAVGASAVRGGVLSGLAAYALEAGKLEEATLLLQRAQACEGRVHRLHQLRLEYATAHLLLSRGELGRALEAFTRTGQRALAAGIPNVAEDCEEGAASVGCEQGALAEALARLEAVQAAHRRRGRRDREAGLVLRAGLVEALLGGDGRTRVTEVLGERPDGKEARGVLALLHRHAGDEGLAEALEPLPPAWRDLRDRTERAPPGSLLRLARRLPR